SLAGAGGLAQIVFHMHIGSALMSLGIIWACVVGLIGGLLAALRAPRIPVALALRGLSERASAAGRAPRPGAARERFLGLLLPMCGSLEVLGHTVGTRAIQVSENLLRLPESQFPGLG